MVLRGSSLNPESGTSVGMSEYVDEINESINKRHRVQASTDIIGTYLLHT